jgi:hypothetical protein
MHASLPSAFLLESVKIGAIKCSLLLFLAHVLLICGNELILVQNIIHRAPDGSEKTHSSFHFYENDSFTAKLDEFCLEINASEEQCTELRRRIAPLIESAREKANQSKSQHSHNGYIWEYTERDVSISFRVQRSFLSKYHILLFRLFHF